MSEEKLIVGRPIPDAMSELECMASEVRVATAEGRQVIAKGDSIADAFVANGLSLTIAIPQDWRFARLLPKCLEFTLKLAGATAPENEVPSE